MENDNTIEILICVIKELNNLILQRYYLNGSTLLMKMNTLLSFKKVYNTMKNIPNLLPDSPFPMVIVIKLSDVEINEFLSNDHIKKYSKTYINTKKRNYSGSPYIKEFENILFYLERWFDIKLKNNCQNCNKDNSEIITSNKNYNNFDIGLNLSFPITVDITGRQSAQSRLIDCRLIYKAGYYNITNGVKAYPIFSGSLVKWCYGHTLTIPNASPKHNSIGEIINLTNTNNYTYINSNNSKKEGLSRTCCLITYLWLRDLYREMYNSDKCTVRLLSINPHRVKGLDIQNEQYIKIKKRQSIVKFSSDYSPIYTQEFVGGIKVILLL
uniref:Wsv267-like protein n=1 Tax=Trachysalambria curvirostris majanivirus TaxID=2984281 RepID=A0A9C7C6R8_9VIRU|nr:MAG: wsv267-like protein [Trachysalambria curvirostris majanivirus]